MRRRSFLFAAALLLAAVMLSGCGEGKQYARAAELEAEGKYSDAYRAYSELGKKKYKDAAGKANEMKDAARSAAKKALTEGRYEEAEALAEDFSPYMADILEYAVNAENGTYVADLTLSEEGRLSFTAAIGTDENGESRQAELEIELRVSPNGRASGTVRTAKEKEPSENSAFFVPERYLIDGRYVIAETPLTEWTYRTDPKGLTVASFDELADSTLQALQMLQMAHFPIAYEAIMNDGTKGAALSEWACGSLRFRDPMKTFAGGTLTVRIVSADDNMVLFEQSVEIPENKDA